jgi:hypothetical protein
MFDPRDDIIGLFTNARIGGSSRFSSSTVYVKLLKTEDNSGKEPNDFGNNMVGIIWLKPPRTVNTCIDVGFSTSEHRVVIDVDMVLPHNDEFLKNVHDSFINSILHSLETTIRTYATKSGVSYDTAELVFVMSDYSIIGVHRRLMEIVCVKSN